MRLTDPADPDDQCPKRGPGLTHTDDGDERCRECGVSLVRQEPARAMEDAIPLDADAPRAGVCGGCGKAKLVVRALPELRAGRGPWCTDCLAEMVRRTVVVHTKELNDYRRDDAEHRKKRGSG